MKLFSTGRVINSAYYEADITNNYFRCSLKGPKIPRITGRIVYEIVNNKNS